MQWLAGVHQDVMALVLLATVAQAEAEGLHFAEIAFPNLAGAGEDLWHLLQAFKFDQAGERKVQLMGVEGVEDNHFVAAKAEMLDPFEDLLFIIEEIADED